MDTIIVNGETRIRWGATGTAYGFGSGPIIEGIGNLDGLIQINHLNNGGPPYRQLQSFCVCGQFLYRAGTAFSCTPSIHCSARFTLIPDTTTMNKYFVVNMASGNGPLTYVWNWGDGHTDSVAYPSHTYSFATTHIICLSITDSVGCSTYSCINSKTLDAVNVIPGINTGIASPNVQHSLFNIYPNPATNSINLTIDETLIGSTLTITDITGRKITGMNLTTQYSLLNTDYFHNGIYFVTICNGKQSATQKLVIEK